MQRPCQPSKEYLGCGALDMFGHPPRPFGRLAVGVLLVIAAGPGLARAQIKHNDFTAMNTPFSTNQASPVYMDATGQPTQSFFVGKTPTLNNRVNDSRATLSGNNNLGGTYSPLNGKTADSPQWKSDFPVGNNLPLKMAPSANTRYPQLQGSLQKDSPLDKFTSSRNLKPNTPAPSTFTDAFTFHAVDNGTELAQVGHDLSLQDVNRYQFQGSFSGTPGLPVTHAGGSSSQASFSGQGLSNLTSSSTLFDPGTVTSRVRSGGTVSPRMVTSDGSMPYGANRNGPFGGSSTTPELHLPMQSIKTSSTNNGRPNPVLPKGALLPAGTYAPTSNGKTITFDVSEPEFVGKGVTEAPDNVR